MAGLFFYPTYMHLLDLTNRDPRPPAWSEGDKIPWNEPGFSARMLKEHLSQNHDHASRRAVKIESQVRWIHEEVLHCRPARILDLGCGPGLYTSRLAGLGHECVGIDFSPASIAYAAAAAADGVENEPRRCTYHLHDIRSAEYGSGYGLVMLVFGEFNMFKPADARRILHKAGRALAPGGLLLLEPHTEAAVRSFGSLQPVWYSSKGGLFSEKPHLCLMESFWDGDSQTAIERYFIVDVATAAVARYAATTQAYSQEAYCVLLEECGFARPDIYPSLEGRVDETQADFFVLLSRKAEQPA